VIVQAAFRYAILLETRHVLEPPAQVTGTVQCPCESLINAFENLAAFGVNAKERTSANANAPDVKTNLILFILNIALLTQKARKTLMKK
jgi:hypothetical protein